MIHRVVPLFAIATLMISMSAAEQRTPERQRLVLDSQTPTLVLDLSGGSIAEFRFNEARVNALNWAAPAPGDLAARGMGHFLCLDRWGPASDAEAARGMPYHGEASSVPWRLESSPGRTGNGAMECTMVATLPKAGLLVRRTVRLSPTAALFTVREEVTNERPLGRVFNMVQHPTIAPPFLDENTLVDCNGGKGFAQGGTLPNPEKPSSDWPRGLKKSGEAVDLRRLTSDPDPNVASFAIDGHTGWITAANPEQGLLIGYVWRTEDYPWVSVWRDTREGKPVARGLEFGTTGLHQPFPTLVKKGKIWERPLFEFIDAGETIPKQYAGFLLKIPADFAGVKSVDLQGDRLVVVEKKDSPDRREFFITLEGLTISR